MSWKKSFPFFAWQSLRYARNLKQCSKIWSYKNRWKQSFLTGRNSINDALPWLNFPALDFLEEQDLSGKQVFEYGGGGSTLFFCKKGARVCTVEDHPEWFAILTETVAKHGFQDWKGHFVSPEKYTGANRRSPENPDDFMSGSPGRADLSFESYARVINQYPANYFDLVLVDGRARPSCIKQALPHLKSGGLLLIDNTERTYYLKAFQKVFSEQFSVEVDEIAPVGYTPDFTRTTVLRKR